MSLLQYGKTSGRIVSGRIGQAGAKATLKAIPPNLRADAQVFMATGDRSLWSFSTSSSAADLTEQLVLTPDTGSGRFLRQDLEVDLKLPVDFSMADATVLFTVPVGFRLLVLRSYQDVTTPFTGGTSATIGLSSSNASYATKGDLQGGAAGDAAAALTAGVRLGSIGAKVTAGVILVAGDTVRFDRITSAFTAGAGFARRRGAASDLTAR